MFCFILGGMEIIPQTSHTLKDLKQDSTSHGMLIDYLCFNRFREIAVIFIYLCLFFIIPE